MRGSSWTAHIRRSGSGARPLVIANYGTLLLGLLSGPLLARALNADGRGALAVASAYATFLATLGGLGLSNALTHARATRADAAARLAAAAVRCALVSAFLILLAAVLLRLGPLRSIASADFVFLLLVSGAFSVGGLNGQALLVATAAYRRLAFLQAVPLVIASAGTVLLFSLGTLTLTWALGVQAAANVISFLCSYTAAGLRLRGPSVPVRQLLPFGLRGLIGGLGHLINARVDQLVLVAFVPLAHLGHYAVAVSVASLPLGLALALGTRLVAQTSAGLAADVSEHSEAARSFARALVLCALSVLAVGAATPFGLPLLYGEEFAPSVALVLALLPGTLALCFNSLSIGVLIALGRPAASSWAEVAALVMTIVGLAIMLRPLGVLGAALTSTIAYTSSAAVFAMYLQRCSFDWWSMRRA